MPTRAHYCLDCDSRLCIVADDQNAICPCCGTEYRVENQENGTRIYHGDQDVCVRKRRMRRVTSKADELAKARSR